jgi:hypothetical protein
VGLRARRSSAPSTSDALALITARAAADTYAWSVAASALPSGLGLHRLTDALLVVTGMLAVLAASTQGSHPTSLLMRLHAARGRGRGGRIDRLAVAVTNAWIATAGRVPASALPGGRRRTAALNLALIDLAAQLAADSDRAAGRPSESLRAVALHLQLDDPADGGAS